MPTRFRTRSIAFAIGFAAIAVASGAAIAQKQAIPPSAQQQKVIEQLEEIYNLSARRSDEENLQLARELFGMVREAKNPPEQFVLARKAMESASSGGDAMLMLAAIDFLAKHFEMDPLVVKGKTLRAFAEKATDKRRIESLVAATHAYANSAVAAQKYDYAVSIATVTYKSTQRASGKDFRQPAMALRQRVERLRDDHAKLTAAKAAVAANPNDPEANLALGRVLCFGRSDWKQGLSHLAKGSDPALAQAAQSDLALPADALAQVRVGDAWWNLAETCGEDEKNAMLLRAGAWYQKAQPTAAGLSRAKVNKRLATIAKLGKVTAAESELPADPVAPASWPGNRPGLVMAWKRGFGTNKIIAPPGAPSKWRMEPRGAATLDRRGAMLVANGAFIVQGANETLLAACKATNELTVEAVFTAANLKQGGPARILSFSTTGHSRNFTLGQSSDQLVFRLRTPRTGMNGSNPETKLAKFAAGVPNHVLVTYRAGELVCYLNGNRVRATGAVQGDFSNWSGQQLLCGDEWKDRRDWSGSLELITIANKFVGPDEAKRHFAAAKNALK